MSNPSWLRDTWRKVYVTKTARWLQLPVSARGLGRELLTYADDDGRLHIGAEQAGRAVAYMLGARPAEHRRIAEDVEALIARGYLVLEADALRIVNYEAAQARESSAARVAKHRAMKRDQALRVTDDVTVTVTPTEPVTETPKGNGSVPCRAVPMIPPMGPPQGDAPPAPKPKRSKVGTRCPPTGDPGVVAWVEANGISKALPRVADQQAFLDHHRAKGSVFLDWGAAARTWARNAVRFAGPGPGGGLRSPEAIVDANAAASTRKALREARESEAREREERAALVPLTELPEEIKAAMRGIGGGL